MTYHLKCKNCNKILTFSDSVFVKVTRYDEFGRRIKKLVFCCDCWDRTTHTTHAEKVTSDDIKKLDNTDSFDEADYYHLNDMQDPECTVKFKYEDLHINSCGKCRHLIFKDYEHHEGFCDLLRLKRKFESPCEHEEEMS